MLPIMVRPLACALLLVLVFPSTAAADLTAFVGVNATPANRPVRGIAAGIGLIIVAFEFEYADTSEDLDEAAAGLRTFMVNGLLQTPFPIAGMQFYATAGGGVFRETLAEDAFRETNVGINVGGGVKLSLLGPLRLRLDYRVFTLRGDALHPRPQRFYAGLNLKF
jgi:opacity protein-like surface antigen